MCGICGFDWEDKKLLNQMLSEMAYRGPDAKGLFLDKGISLGNVRLSIIDLSKRGNQPMLNVKKSLVISYNGELYNYKTLREDLINKGHKFCSETDTEVILQAYEEYGSDCLSRLNGIFAFCIYDIDKRKLFLARDQLGVKPLYYSSKDKKFIFASEIKSILRYQTVKPNLNTKALPYYLSLRYVPGPQTMFQGIYKLLPGNYILYDLKTKSVITKSYWSILSAQETSNNLRTGLVEQLRDKLKEAVNAQMIGDVPCGLFLSGGLDSSSVLAFMRQANPNSRISTFSLGFEDCGGYDNELKYARLVSDHFGTDHHEETISPDSLNILPNLVFHMDEPVSDATIIPTYFLSKSANKKVKFVLTGEGGDELFGGYVHYGIINKLNILRNILPSKKLTACLVKRIPSDLLTRLFEYPSKVGDEGRQRLSELILDLDDKEKTYLNLISTFSEHDKKEVINKSVYSKVSDHLLQDLKKYFDSKGNWLSQVQLMEMQTWLPDYILLRLDKIGMACSLESRVPLLDLDLVNFVNSLAHQYKQGKHLLRLAVKPYLPKKIVTRKKYPFVTPLEVWYSKGYKEIAECILDKNDGIYQFVNKAYVDKLLRKKGDSSMLHSRQLWAVLTLSVWYKLFIEKVSLKFFKV